MTFAIIHFISRLNQVTILLVVSGSNYLLLFTSLLFKLLSNAWKNCSNKKLNK